eukprot:1157371-Pelagomonas_calceolata.AAC.4
MGTRRLTSSAPCLILVMRVGKIAKRWNSHSLGDRADGSSHVWLNAPRGCGWENKKVSPQFIGERPGAQRRLPGMYFLDKLCQSASEVFKSQRICIGKGNTNVIQHGVSLMDERAN